MYAQKIVLYETFINSFINCPAVDDFSTQVQSTLTADQGKYIYLNYHVSNVGDPMSASSVTANTMFDKIVGSTNIINFSSVDRTKFSSSGLKLTSGKSEWDARITSQSNLTTPVTISLVSAQIDTLSSITNSRLVVKVNVGGAQTTDTMTIHYAITQDGVYFPQCPTATPAGPTTHNDVVRYVTVADSLLDFKSQTQNTVTYEQNITKTFATFDLSKMKLIAWVEDHSPTDYTVAQAALLKTNLKNLPPPAVSLSLNSAILDNKSFAPGDLVSIVFDKISIDSIKVEFSSDGGTTWQNVGVTHDFQYYWNAPAISTTKGKIRISEQKTGNPIVTETGTFTIAQPDHSLSILHPNGNDIAYIGSKFNVTWNQHGVDTLFVEYSSDNGNHWQTLNLHKDPTGAANSYQWTVAGPATAQALMRLRPFAADQQTLVSLSDPFQVQNTVTGKVNTTSDESFAISVSPQPLMRSQQLKLNLKLDSYSSLAISLYDLSGTKVYSNDHSFIEAGDHTIPLDVHSLAAGVYILEVRRDDGAIRTVKVEVL
jgi:hypothetical protein